MDKVLEAELAARTDVHSVWLLGNRKALRFDERALARVAELPSLQRWGLEQQALRRLPANVGKLTELTELSLRDCPKLESLAGVEQLTSLQSIELWDLPKLDLGDEFARLAELPHLAKISLRGRYLQELPAVMGGLAKVEVVEISSAPNLEIDTALTALGTLPSLCVLELRFIETKCPLPNTVGALDVEELDLSNSAFTVLPSTIGKLRRLRRLDVHHNELRGLPVELCRLTALEELVLSYNASLRKLPAAIGELEHLSKLDLEATNVSELPASATQWKRMRVLIAPKVVSVPDGFFDAMRFETVKLSREISSQARFVPLDTSAEELELESVERLQDDLGDPRILTIKLPQLEVPLVGLSRMKRLERAEINIPPALWTDTIGRLAGARQLRRLRLVGRREHVWQNELPDSIGDLASLEELTVSDCGLSSLPPTIGRLAQLRVLFLGGNQLTTLPDELGALSRLEKLELEGNPLVTFPACIGRLTALRALRQQGANMNELPDEMAALVHLEDLELQWGADNPPAVLGRLPSLRRLSFERRGAFDWASLFRILAACPLESLTISTAQLDQLPSEIADIQSLQTLHLGRARVRKLPDLSTLHHLRWIIVNHEFLMVEQSVRDRLGKGWRRKDRGPTQSTYVRS